MSEEEVALHIKMLIETQPEKLICPGCRAHYNHTGSFKWTNYELNDETGVLVVDWYCDNCTLNLEKSEKAYLN